ncbi:MAG: hypothetical protein CM15mP130_1570 [Verrucomicrobiota bacterium]|nr:MAG: hypothetical protein CM15mP130_1570 [Verrucomicrobiota bacterium]
MFGVTPKIVHFPGGSFLNHEFFFWAPGEKAEASVPDHLFFFPPTPIAPHRFLFFPLGKPRLKIGGVQGIHFKIFFFPVGGLPGMVWFHPTGLGLPKIFLKGGAQNRVPLPHVLGFSIPAKKKDGGPQINMAGGPFLPFLL